MALWCGSFEEWEDEFKMTAKALGELSLGLRANAQIANGKEYISGRGVPHMDPITVATFISLQIASGFLKEHGKEIYGKVKELLRPEELITLNLLENHPGNGELQQQVAGLIGKQLATNSDLARECETLLENFRASISIENQIRQTGDDNIAMQGIHGSQININK